MLLRKGGGLDQPLRADAGKPITEQNASPLLQKINATFRDQDGDYLEGGTSYKLHLPPNVPAANFWSVTLYDALTASGLDNGQPFPSFNSMEKPTQNANRMTLSK